MHSSCHLCFLGRDMSLCRDNSCPQCRLPMQSRRDCKKDPRFDCFLELLYHNIELYEEQVSTSSLESWPSAKHTMMRL